MPRFPLRIFRLPYTRAARRRRIYTMLVVISVVVVFIMPFYVIYKPPNLLICYFQRRWPDVLWHVPASALRRNGKETEKVVALTIDDAPSTYTTEILKVLGENEAQATFFVIGGQVGGRETILQDTAKAGMELGNHAMHDEPSRSLTPSTLDDEIRQVQGYINRNYDAVDLPHPPRYFRPGSGFFSTRMRRQITEMGYQMVLGSVYPHDPQIAYPSLNARHVLSMVRPGSIIICHDRRQWTVPMLRKVLPELKKRGYRVTTVSGLLDAAGRTKAA
ncbi:hypothetical protein ACJQWK_03878 [Exserohilum turcicum]|uniref:chitin deacetylase n=1 Tax=Exserohilum turcicum (strain 28A) TaxID=671987 RepID=R0KTC1_EXST2|nr:carbohydrate esterase family 4 protein [Exserohilum turcica Et28A]EOA92159.1 carbohydrate esterase family 4 protein [Exserohilum turcica Et28A]